MRARAESEDVVTRRLKGVLGLALTVALGIGVLQGVPAQAAPGSPAASSTAAESASDDPVPVPSAEPADGDVAQASPAPVLPEYDLDRWDQSADDAVARALVQAAQTGEPVEVESQTTETMISYAQPDGTVQVQSTAGPVRAEVDGEWVDVDTTLRFAEDGVRPIAVTGEIIFSPGGDEPMAVLSDGESATLRLDWNGQLPTPVLEANVATYREVMPNVDLVLTATRLGFEQHVVVKQRPDALTVRM